MGQVLNVLTTFPGEHLCTALMRGIQLYITRSCCFSIHLATTSSVMAFKTLTIYSKHYGPLVGLPVKCFMPSRRIGLQVKMFTFRPS